MPRLNHPNEAPPDGWFFVARTGLRIDGWDLFELIERTALHYEHKGIEFGSKDDLRREIEAQICSAMPPGVCRGEPGEEYHPFHDASRDFTRESVLAASAASLAWLKTGLLEEKTESARRAAICRTCRFNRPSPSWVCSALCATLEQLVPAGRREPGLSLCGICSCSLTAKVIAPMAVIAASNAGRNLAFPSFCWQGEDSTNPQNLSTNSQNGEAS